MNTQQYRITLVPRNNERRSRQIRRDDIAVEKYAEVLDEQASSLISEALERIENHTYGLCADCAEQIGEKRLAALPWAKYCIVCQEAADSPGRSWKDVA